MLAGGNVLAEAVVSTESPRDENLLMVLGVDRIAARLHVAFGEPPAAIPLPVSRREGAAPQAST